MRYSLVFAGALAGAASASPALFKRYYVTEYAYVTDVVTVTAGGQQKAAPTPTDVSVAAVPTNNNNNWPNFANWWNNKPSFSYEAPSISIPTVAYTPPAAPTTYQAPPPPSPTTTQQAEPTHTYTPPTKPSSPSYGGSTPSYGGGAPAYSDIVVMHHNLHRANHSAPPVVWDQGLADTALAIAQSCDYAHNVYVSLCSDSISRLTSPAT